MNNKPCFDGVLGYLFRIKRRAKAMGAQRSQRPIEPRAEGRISGKVLLERVAGDAQRRYRSDRAQRGRCRLRFEQRQDSRGRDRLFAGKRRGSSWVLAALARGQFCRRPCRTHVTRNIRQYQTPIETKGEYLAT